MKGIADKQTAKKWFKTVLRLLGYAIYNVRRIRPSPARKFADRFEYQSKLIEFDILTGTRVLDIGSGGYPFPYATILADRYLDPSRHRSEAFESEDKPVVVCDVDYLPFRDRAFDFVYCSHLLEHVQDPIQAIQEITRVAPKGYIETPHFMSDALFSWAEGRHKWFVQSIDTRLVFFEYDTRRVQGTRSAHWADVILGDIYHPLQDLYADNMDIFNTMFCWKDSVAVDVYYTDGSVRSNRS